MDHRVSALRAGPAMPRLGRHGQRFDPWRRRLYMGSVWLLAALVFFVLPNILVSILFPMVHPEYRQATVCVAMVWPLFFIPAFVGLLAARRALRRAIVATGEAK